MAQAVLPARAVGSAHRQVSACGAHKPHRVAAKGLTVNPGQKKGRFRPGHVIVVSCQEPFRLKSSIIQWCFEQESWVLITTCTVWSNLGTTPLLTLS